MKKNSSIVFAFLLLLVVSALYRIIPGRPFGFAPQWAMALFSGAIFIHNKKWAFALPLLSMFLSDVLYEVLYYAGITQIPGFYEGQWVNYILFTSLTVVGFFIKKIKILPVFLASLASPTVYFILSNFFVWLGGGGFQRPKTVQGLLMCYNDGFPFYLNSVLSTVFFSAVFFVVYYFVVQKQLAKQTSA